MPSEDDLKLCSEFAERLGLDGKERDSFISSSMTRLGYKRRDAWDDPEPEVDEGDEDGDYFTSRRKREESSGREKRKVGGKRASGGGDWQYGSDEE